MKKTVFFFIFVLFCSWIVFGQNMSLPSSQYYEQLLQANGCGSIDGINVPDFIFKDACDHHDIGYSSYGIPRNVSDRIFYQEMAKACRDTFGNFGAAITGCYDIAGIYFLAVRVFGGNAYNNAQRLARQLEAAKERERGMCYPDDIYIRQSGDTYFLAIDWR